MLDQSMLELRRKIVHVSLVQCSFSVKSKETEGKKKNSPAGYMCLRLKNP